MRFPVLGLMLMCVALEVVEAQNLRPTRRDPLVVESIRRQPTIEGVEFATTDYLRVTAQIEVVDPDNYPGGEFFADILVDGKRVERISSASISMRDLWNNRRNKDTFHAVIGFLKAGTHTITVVVDDDGDIDESNERDNSFSQRITIKEPWLRITKPRAGVNWLVDSRQRIEWEAYGLDSGVGIEYSFDGGRRWIRARTNGPSGQEKKLQTTGYDDWEVVEPGGRLRGEVEYLIRAYDSDDRDVNDEVAVVVDVPFVELETDPRGQVFNAGDPIEVSWDAHVLDEVRVRFRHTHPLARNPILDRLDGDARSYVLTAPQINCDSCRVFIETGIVGVRDWTGFFAIRSDVVDSTTFYNVPEPVVVDTAVTAASADSLVVPADSTATAATDSALTDTSMVVAPADSLVVPAPVDTTAVDSAAADTVVVLPADSLAVPADSLVVAPADTMGAAQPDSAVADTLISVASDSLVVPADTTATAPLDSTLADTTATASDSAATVSADSTATTVPDTVAQADSLVVPADTTVATETDTVVATLSDTATVDTIASSPPDTNTPPPVSAPPSGDISGDGELGLVDALAIATYVLDPQAELPPGFDPMAGDVNGDGELSLIDALMVATYLIDPDNPALPSSLRQKAVVLDLGPLQAGEVVAVRIAPANARAYQVHLGWDERALAWVEFDGLVALQEARTGRLHLFDVGAGPLQPVVLHFRARSAGRATLAVGQQALGPDLLPRVVEVQPLARPRTTSLYANVPNPFNPETTLRYALAEAGPVQLRIYDATGRVVRELVDEYGVAGEYAVVWDGRDRAGRAVASGVYFYRLQTEGFSQVRRMLLLK